MAEIRIVQCLCPARHCILAFPYTPGMTTAHKDLGGCVDIILSEESAANYLRDMVEGLVASRAINPWCGICDSRTFQYEDRVTAFQSMEEAVPFLRRLEAEQSRAAAVLQNKN
jgi:hypothetical protein